MSNFLKQHLQLGSVNSNCVAPSTPKYDLGEFFPPDFLHLSERPNRIPAQPRKYDVIGDVIDEFINNQPLISLINP